MKPKDRLRSELQDHIDRMVRDSIAAGVDPAEAARLARLEFGGVEQIAEHCRDVRGRWLDDFLKDLRYAARTLRRSPGFLAVAVLSLALGIGANTAIFTLINAVMLERLPVREPDRLVQITRVRDNGQPASVSYKLFEHLRDNLKSASSVLVARQGGPFILVDGIEEPANVEHVSADYFTTLRLNPAAGRLLEPADQTSVSVLPAVISHRYWEQRFALDPQIVGKLLATRGTQFRIVGVMPAGFEGLFRGRTLDIAMPLAPLVTAEQKDEFTNNFLEFVARLKPGVTLQQANAEAQVLWDAQLQAYTQPITDPKERQNLLSQKIGVFDASTGINPLFWNYSQPLLVLMGIVALVLLLACSNLSGLLLARAASRQREISIRLAIGAGRGRLLRQFLTESLVLAALGGAGGLLLARALSASLVAMLGNGVTLALSISPDWRVLVFTGAMSVIACLLAGLAPALHAMRANLNPALKEGRAGHRRLGKGLVVAQLAISMVLVVGAALFIGTLGKLYSADRGFRSDGVLVLNIRGTRSYPEPRGLAIQSDLVARLASLPGVVSAGAARVLPISTNLWARAVQVEGYSFRPDENEVVGFNAVAPQYFTTIGTPLFQGREFDSRDTATSPKVAIVNQAFARYFFGDRSPLGRRITSVEVTYEIVGVVGDAKYTDLRTDIMKTMYICWQQRPGMQPGFYTYIARVAGGNPLNLAPMLDRLVQETDAGLRVQQSRTYATLIDQSIVTERVLATLGGFFGVLALIVACLGIFGVMAFQVSRRINELGLRMALGASRGHIVSLVLREVTLMLAAGTVIGCGAALTLTGLTSKLLFGVTSADPAVFAVAAAILCAAAFAAAWLPARRASRVDPMAALRHE